VREIGHRVKHWQSGTMVLRWTAAGVPEAERGFRKVVGYRAMPTLVAALRARDTQFDRSHPGIDGLSLRQDRGSLGGTEVKRIDGRRIRPSTTAYLHASGG
jgi:hypothetical protein